MSGASSRRKGIAWERTVARAFVPLFAEKVHRGFQFRSGAEEPDVVVPGFWVECKAGRTTQIKAAFAQAVEASQHTDRVPLVVCKDDRAPALVALTFEAFLDILRDALAWRAQDPRRPRENET